MTAPVDQAARDRIRTDTSSTLFVNAGARALLLQGERQRFLGEEWPRVSATIERLGLSADELLAHKKR